MEIVDTNTNNNEYSIQQQLQELQHEQEETEENIIKNWWKQRFPKQFIQEKERMFHLSIHCKNRTRLYHTLLHYKFRLLLTIREKLLLIANKLAATTSNSSSNYSSNSNSSSGIKNKNSDEFNTAWEHWDSDDRFILLTAAVEQICEDTNFIDTETYRFQKLLKETERRYGGREEPVRLYSYTYKLLYIVYCSIL